MLRGILGYGASSVIHTARLIDISENLPVIIEIINTEEKINSFIPLINDIFENSRKGGLVTLEKMSAISL